MILKKYHNYIFRVYCKNFLSVCLIFTCIGFIINLFEEIKFFEKYEADIFYPIYLSLLNVPSLLFEIFPFIFLLTTKFFFINLNDKHEFDILNTNGVSNFKILSSISFLVTIISIILIIFFYSFSSKFKTFYLDIKNSFSNNNEYLAVVNDDGLWIKEEIDGNLNIIHAEKIEKNLLKKVTISRSEKGTNSNHTYVAVTANITKKKWILNEVKILNNEGNKDLKDTSTYQSTFNGEIISRLFSNLNSLNLYQLHELSENYNKIGYSTTEVKIHLNKVYSSPVFFILMTILGFLIMFKFSFINSKFLTITVGIFVSVTIYYLNYFSSLLGSNEILPIYISVWTPHLILFLTCSIGLIKINEK